MNLARRYEDVSPAQGSLSHEQRFFEQAGCIKALVH